MICVAATGPFSTIQDLGREAYIREGIGPSGAMDAWALRRANRLVGNADGAAGIETTGAPLELEIGEAGLIAVTGAPGQVKVNGIAIPSDWAEPVAPGDRVIVAPSASAMWRYVAVSGGIETRTVLGSRSTDLKNRFGGVGAGRPLRPGDDLPVGSATADGLAWIEQVRRLGGVGLSPPVVADNAVIRVLPAREYPVFTAQSQEAFWSAPWTVGAGSNRQGYQFSGPILETKEPLSLLSYGLIAGIIQVPQAGQPIVQLAEANTCGGYPKIGCVISADLGRLAQLRPGQSCRFQRVTREEALTALRLETARLDMVQAVPEALAS